MENLKEFNDTFKIRVKAYYKKSKKIEKQIMDLERKKEHLKYPRFIDTIRPIVKEIEKKLKADGYILYGPFGLCNERTIYWVKDKKKEITCEGNVLGKLCLIDSADGFGIKNYTKDTKTFSPGTIGEMNGMNYLTIQINDKMNINWLVKFVKIDFLLI